MITLDFILDEYMRELCMEGFRWYTLKRTGKLLERALKYNPDVKDKMKAYHVTVRFLRMKWMLSQIKTNSTSYQNMINNF